MALNRIEIEAMLNKDRAWLIETYAALSEEELLEPVTRSEHDPNSTWTAKDHLAHLSAIEFNFVAMVRRHLKGDANPVGLINNKDGTPRPREEIMAGVHRMTEDWTNKHRDRSLSEVVALGQQSRAQTIALLAELSDEQLAEKLPGAPWADGTIGGVLAANAAHGRMHYSWVKEGWASGSSAARS